jgi:hypothetical protein
MEAFSLAAQHTGAIAHNHNIAFSPSTVDAIREVRIAISVIVVGWVATTALRGWLYRSKD